LSLSWATYGQQKQSRPRVVIHTSYPHSEMVSDAFEDYSQAKLNGVRIVHLRQAMLPSALDLVDVCGPPKFTELVMLN
jgi:hypothetical protein